MYSPFHIAVGLPFLIVALLALALHGLSRFLILSRHRRSCYLFGDMPWLPLRNSLEPLSGEDVQFESTEKITLRGKFLPKTGERDNGTILFCHELNGSCLNIGPYVKSLTESGFNILTFDFRNHGSSDSSHYRQSSPWVTTSDLDDAKAAIDYLCTQRNVDPNEIGVFGLGKGATVALCLAGLDDKVKSVVLDAPMAESRLFQRDCWQALVKSTRLSRRSGSKFFSLFMKAVLYSVSCPFVALALAWKRFILGLWFDCRFVNSWSIIKNVRQPIMIVHGYADSNVRPNQIQAFCDRMPTRPTLWFAANEKVSTDRFPATPIPEDCCQKVARFLQETI